MSAPSTVQRKESARGALLALLLEPCGYALLFVILGIASTRAVVWMMMGISVFLSGGALIYVGRRQARGEADGAACAGDPP
jgi:hypothetical protein